MCVRLGTRGPLIITAKAYDEATAGHGTARRKGGTHSRVCVCVSHEHGFQSADPWSQIPPTSSSFLLILAYQVTLGSLSLLSVKTFSDPPCVDIGEQHSPMQHGSGDPAAQQPRCAAQSHHAFNRPVILLLNHTVPTLAAYLRAQQ